jgi:hypothetical protein
MAKILMSKQRQFQSDASLLPAIQRNRKITQGVTCMRRLVRRPTFWVFLIAVSLTLNIFVGWVAVHRIPHAVSLISPASSVPFKKAPEKHETEQVLWRRLLQETSECAQESKSIATNTKNNTLPAFGFSAAVNRFIDSADITSQSTCYFPPSLSCHVTKYSVIVVSNGTNLRQLFLNLMSFLSYPSLQDLTLILPMDRDALEQDRDYGKRLLEWDKQKKIRLLPLQSLWWAMQHLEPQSEAVLWMNGDGRKDWNGTVLKSHMQMWRQQSSSLMATNALQHGGGVACLVPQLHGLVVHRDFLCYLDHPVIDPLRHYTEPLGWEATQHAMGMLFQRVANGLVESSVYQTNPVLTKSLKLLKTTQDYFGCCTSSSAIPDSSEKCLK